MYEGRDNFMSNSGEETSTQQYNLATNSNVIAEKRLQCYKYYAICHRTASLVPSLEKCPHLGNLKLLRWEYSSLLGRIVS